MSKSALIIRNLSIDKMPGFPKGMKAMDYLASNINVIAGPNASGKSSTARMIQNVIWKQNIDRISVAAKIEIDKKEWGLHIDSGYYSSQSNGLDEPLPSIPAVEEAKRYFLALHELIKEDDQNLAAAILQEAIGGYDLQEAKKSLEYSSSTPNRRINEYRNYEAKREKVESLEKEQIGLQNEEKKLAGLTEKLDVAKNAVILQQGYAYLIEVFEAQSQKKILEEQKELFPKQMPLLIGNEYEVLNDLEKSINNRKLEIARVDREKESKRKELAELQIPENGFDKVVLDTLHEKIEKLAESDRNIDSKRIAIAKNEEETKVRLHRLFSDLSKENLDNINLESIHDLDIFFEKAASLLYKKQTYEEEIKKLKKEKCVQTNSIENLHHGIKILLSWYEKDTSPADVSKTHLWILFVLGAITIISTYLFEEIGMAGVIVMLSYVLYLHFRKQSTDSLKDSRVSDFKRTGLNQPTKWEEEAVSKDRKS